ncbi:MAG: phosphoribosylanthranilate isomerase [Armatimonadetes bacterium]|nr:phosphoribosylanthranilate isomerase [Armatimonadota bacterium]
MTRVKICGITNSADAVVAWRAGADAIGMIFAPSRRQVDVPTARRIASEIPPFVLKVGVFVNEDPHRISEITHLVGLQAVQFHGDESPEACQRFAPNCIKVFRPQAPEDLEAIRFFPAGAFLLDTWSDTERGGSGKTFDWSLARYAMTFGRPVILSGGLTPDNVAEAVRTVQPAMVDVASGVEADVGHKDPALVRRFIEAVKLLQTPAE